MTVKKLVLPEPAYTLLKREDEGANVYAAINTTLANLNNEQNQLFSWQLSLILDLKTEDEDGMTLDHEAKEIEPFCIQLEEDLRKNGNAIPLAKITWKKTRELLFRVYNPVIANDHLTKIIEAENNPRPFTYTIDPDEKWEMAEIYLKQFQNSQTPQ